MEKRRKPHAVKEEYSEEVKTITGDINIPR